MGVMDLPGEELPDVVAADEAEEPAPEEEMLLAPADEPLAAELETAADGAAGEGEDPDWSEIPPTETAPDLPEPEPDPLPDDVAPEDAAPVLPLEGLGAGHAGVPVEEGTHALGDGRWVTIRQDIAEPSPEGEIVIGCHDSSYIAQGISAEVLGDTLVLRGLAILDIETGEDGVQLDDAAMAQLAGLIAYETGDFGGGDAGDGRLSWLGGEALLLDWDAPDSLSALLAQGGVELL